MATITFDQINKHMRDSENIYNSEWIREEMKKSKYYTELKIEQHESKPRPKYFPDYEKLFTIIHKKCNRNWTEPIPVSGHMGEIVYIEPPKKKNSGPITFGHEIPSKPIGKEMTEEELDKFMEDCLESDSDSDLEEKEDEEDEEEEEEEEEDTSNKQETEAELREKYRKITSNLFAEN